MTRRHIIAAGVGAALMIVGALYGTFWILRQPVPQATSAVPIDTIADEVGDEDRGEPVQEPGPAVVGGTIQVRLYVLGPSGQSLQTESQEIHLGASLQEQCRQVLELLLRRSAAIPSGVQLREVFISSQGVAYVDLSQEFVDNHPGGSSAEELTVFGLSNTLIANFPAIKMVKILVEGREIQSLAGHLDLTVPYGRAPAYLNPAAERPEPLNDTN